MESRDVADTTAAGHDKRRAKGWRHVLAGLGFAAFAAAHAPAQAADILVVDYNIIPGLATNLSNIATAAGDTVTIVSGLSAGNIPTTLSGFAQIWDLGANQPLSYTSQYTSYLQGGGDLFVMGENPGYGATRDAAISSFLTALGGGNVAVNGYSGGTQTVASQFQTANQTSSVSFAAIGAFSSLGTGTCISADTSGNCGAAAWGVGTLSNAMQGALISVLDVNFLDPDYLQQPFVENLLGYLEQQQQIGQGGGATSITSTVNAAGLASSPATLNPVFDGGKLVLDGTALDSYTFTITGNNGTVDLAGQSATIANPIADATSGTPGSLTVTNSGTGGALTLTAANTYTGATTIDSGATLALAGDGSIAASSGVADNGVFDISGANSGQMIGNLTGSGAVNLGSNTLITTNASGTFSGVIGGTGNFGVVGGSQTLTGQNTFTGQAGVDTGATLALSGNGSIANANNLIDNGSFDISGANGNRTVGSLMGTGTVNLGSNSLGLTNASGVFAGVFAGTIGGTGGFAVLGGTETLAGVNTYTGATGIASGATLALAGNGSIASSSGVLADGVLDISQSTGAASIATLAGSGAVNLGANTLALTHANDTFSGTIGGTGGVTLNGGTQVLSGANTYTGGTVVNGATLVANSIGSGALTLNGGTFATGAAFAGGNDVTVAANGGVINNGGHDDTFSGTISGAGHLSLSGTGTTTLSGANTYSGGTTISQSMVAINAANNLGTGSLTLDGGVLKTLAALTETAPITVTAKGGAIDNMGFDNMITGAISGTGGMLFAGSGTTTLSGANTYTGGTTVETGTLQLGAGGSLVGNVAVQSGGQFLPGTGSFSGSAANYGVTTLSSGQTATFGGGFTNAGLLSGAGTIKGDVVNTAGGVMVAGNAVTTGNGVAAVASGGTTTVQGNLTLGSGSNVVFAIAPTTTPTAGAYGAAPSASHTQINVTGNITLAGAATVYASAGNYLKTTYVLIDNPDPTATLTGKFSSVQVAGLAQNYGFYMTYDADPQVAITVFPTAAFTPRAMTANQRNVAAVLDGAVQNASGALETSLNNLYMQSAADQTRALDRLDGQMYADTVAVLTDSVRDSWDPVYSHLGLSRRVGANVDKDVWINSTGSIGHLEGNDNADGLRTTTGGFLAGAQTRYSGWTLGATAGVTHVGATRDYANDTLSATLWQTGLYASRPVGSATAGLLVGYTQGPVSYGDASQTARVVSAQARVAKTWEIGGGNSITPLVAFDAAHIDLNGTRESDPALGLNVPGDHTTTADARFMLRFDHAWKIKSTDWVASFGAGMRQLLGTSASTMTLGINGIPGQLFTVQGTGMSRTVGEFTAGVSAHLNERLSVDVNYEGQYGGHTRNNILAGRVNWLF
jgi:autotransporter-associated beta strand protein